MKKFILAALLLAGCGSDDTAVIEDSHIKIEITKLPAATVSIEEIEAAVKAVLAIQN